MNIVKNRSLWFSISSVLVLGSIFTLFFYGLPLGIDFTGGTLIEVHFENTEVNSNEIKEIFAESDENLSDPSVISTDDNGYIIRSKNMSEETHQNILTAFKEKWGKLDEPRFTTIGPTIGETIKEKAVLAIIITVIMIVLFVAFAFRKMPRRKNPWKFGIVAIIALIHDITITVGIFTVVSHFYGYEANSLFITALLTILGYSVNDTIVVFDRIRENLKNQGRDETFADTAEKSLKQTITRSINTSLSTLITLVALFLFGGDTIKFFVLTLIIGTIIGTYSSIFLASPLLVSWQPKKRV